MDAAVVELPRWDMSSVYGAGPESADRAFATVIEGITELGALFDRRGIGRRPTPEVDAPAVAAAEDVIHAYNRVVHAAAVHESYLYCVVSADTGDTQAQSALSELRQHKARLAQLDARFTAWIGSLDVEALIAASPVARDHAFILRDAHQRAAHLMSQAEEELAAELSTSGAGAWFRLRDDLEAALTASVELDGEVREIPLGEIWNLLSSPDRSVRRRADEAMNAAWRSQAVSFAAALNGVKGETITLVQRRNWADPLEASLAQNRIDRETLDAMLGAIRGAIPDLRRFLSAKARGLGLPVLASYDILAPMGETGDNWPYGEAAAFVTERFRSYSPKLTGLAERAGTERWIDAGPREGKVGGGFCFGVGNGASRILLNYAPNFFWMSALAHELGHAYHELVQHEFGRTWLQRSLTPATLAETASTFCETLVQEEAWATAAEADKLEILNGILVGQMGNVFSTVSLFDLELAIFDARRERQLSVDELGALSVATQRELLGDAVDPETLSPFRWASLPHFYLPELWYYNFPYAFGLLFGLGLYARYREDPEAFRAGLDELLADTGMADAADLAARFGIDLHAPAFWDAGLATIRENFARFEALVDQNAAHR